MSSTDQDARSRLAAFVDGEIFRRSVMAVIIFNAFTLGLEALPFEAVWFTRLAPVIDRVVVTLFLFELVLKLMALRGRFFKSGWNWFDMIVILISVLPLASGFSVLRSIRVLRAIRLLSTMPEMRKVVEALLHAIPGMGAVIAVLALIFYVSAVMATNLFAASNPERFGSLADSAFSLFQVMTLEGWAADLALPVMDHHPWAWAFFLLFIVLTSFAILNLFIAIIVDSLQSKHFDDELARDTEAQQDLVELHTEIIGLRGEIATLTALVQGSAAGPGGGSSGNKAPKAADRSE